MAEIQRIVGLDLSLTATGFYIFDLNPAKDCSTESGGLLSTGKLEGLARLDSLLSQVQALVDPVTLAVIEDFSFASHGQAVFQIGGLGWMIRHRLWKDKVQTLLCAPSQVKKFATGKGNAEKALMLKEVYKRWHMDFSDDNVADAYTLARIGRAFITWDLDLTSFQFEVLQKLRGKDGHDD